MKIRFINNWTRSVDFNIIKLQICRFYGTKIEFTFLGLGFVVTYLSKKQRLKIEKTMGFLSNTEGWED